MRRNQLPKNAVDYVTQRNAATMFGLSRTTLTRVKKRIADGEISHGVVGRPRILSAENEAEAISTTDFESEARL